MQDIYFLDGRGANRIFLWGIGKKTLKREWKGNFLRRHGTYGEVSRDEKPSVQVPVNGRQSLIQTNERQTINVYVHEVMEFIYS